VREKPGRLPPLVLLCGRCNRRYLTGFSGSGIIRLIQVHDPTLHPMEWHETCHDIHKFQSRLQARPGLRAGRWKGQKPDQSIIKSPQAKRESLAKLGMTEAELDVWYALADVVSQMYKLPTLHPMEAYETQHDFHKLQLRLLARPGLRAAGWPGKTRPR